MPGDRPNARTGAKKPGDAGARGMAGATLGQHDPQRRAEIIPARSLADVRDQAKKLRWAEAGRDAVGQLTSGWPSGRAGSSPAPRHRSTKPNLGRVSGTGQGIRGDWGNAKPGR